MPLSYERTPLTPPPRPLSVRLLLWFFASLLSLIVIIAAALGAVFSFEQYTLVPLVEKLVQNATGRVLSIEGELDARPGWTVSVYAERIRLANADWGSREDMLAIEGAEVSVDLRRLLDGMLVIESARTTAAAALFEQDAQGLSNWSMASGEDPPTDTGERLTAIPLLIAEADLADITVDVVSPALTRPLNVHLESVTQQAGLDDELNAAVVGTVNDRPIAIEAQIAPFTQLLAARAVRFNIDADIDELRLAVDGEVDDLLDPGQPQVQITAAAPEVAQITSMFGLAPTLTGALNLSADVRSPGDHHAIDIGGSVGPYSLSADLRLRALDSIDGLVAEIRAQGPDLRAAANLAGVAGMPPEPFSIRSRAALSGKRLEVQETRIEAGDTLLTLSGVMNQFPQLQESNAELDLRIENYLAFAELLGLADIERLEPAVFELSADLEYSGRDKQTVVARATLGDIESELRGQLTEYPDFVGSKLSYLVNGPDSAKILRALGRPQSVKEAFILHGDLERTEQGVTIEKGALLLGPHELHVEGIIGNDPLRETTALAVQLESPDPVKLVTIAGYTGFLPQGATTIDIKASAAPEGIRLETLSADLAQTRLRASGLISVADDLAGSQIEVKLESSDVAELVPPAARPYVQAGQALSVDGKLQTRANELVIEALAATLGKLQLELSWNMGMQQPLQQTRLSFALSGPNLARVLPPEQDLPYELPAEEFAVSGEVGLTADGLALKSVEATVGPNRAAVSGIVPLQTPTEGLRLEVSASGPDLATLVPPEFQHLDIKASPFEVGGDFTLADGRVSIEQFSLSVARGSLRGNVSMAMQDPRSFGYFDMQGSGVNLEEFLPDLPDYRPAAVPFELKARGGWNLKEVTIEEGRLDLDQTSIELTAEIDLPPHVTATRVVFTAKGDDLSDIGEIRGIELPPDEFHVSAELNGDATKLVLPELTAGFGESDLQGSFSIEFAEKPAIEVALTSETLDLTKFFPAAEVAPGQPEETQEDQPAAEEKKSTPQQNEVAAQESRLATEESPTTSNARLIPDIPVPVDDLNSINLVTRISLQEIRLPRHTIRDLNMDTTLLDGDLTVTRFNAKATEGEFTVSFRATANGNAITTRGSLRGVDVVLGTGGETESGTKLPEQDFYMRFDTEGSTVRELAANLDGQVQLIGGTGRLENTGAVQLLGDFTTTLLTTINPFYRQEPYTAITCSALYADIVDGRIEITPGAVMQTDKLNIFGRGAIDLKTEQLALRFDTAARTGIGVSVADFVNPFVGVAGTLANPRLGLDPQSAALEGSLAYMTGGMSVIFKGVVRRWFGARDPCGELAKVAAKERDKKAKEAEKAGQAETVQ